MSELPKCLRPTDLIRPVVIWPDERLRRSCEPIYPQQYNSEELFSQAGQMILALWKYKGIGLAANQLGYDNQMIVVVPFPEKNTHKHGYPIVMCNPQIVINGTLMQTMPEGCLSFPGQRAIRRRHARIFVAYRTIDGVEVTRGVSGLLSQCVQHEVDHLNGIIFTDPAPTTPQDTTRAEVDGPPAGTPPKRAA